MRTIVAHQRVRKIFVLNKNFASVCIIYQLTKAANADGKTQSVNLKFLFTSFSIWPTPIIFLLPLLLLLHFLLLSPLPIRFVSVYCCNAYFTRSGPRDRTMAELRLSIPSCHLQPPSTQSSDVIHLLLRLLSETISITILRHSNYVARSLIPVSAFGWL